ncbi:DNA recombination and repair protein RecO [Marinobacterium lacunae]|uniref:DNA repair protein RecO n=1 Tax=Marinobacterium lacunae TaxID=1232683 RepID=A0A081G466_9GAMM|nr:DNA repair protein RecO [Marinobacterium lacunae]KEA65571.1 DNA recombination and repair protein RecO [Marinobacterium lacunae]
MSQRVESSAGYVLHTRPYRESSLLVDLLTLEEGKISAVARGARRPKSRLRAALQPFQVLQLGWHGRHELKNLGGVEHVEVQPPLSGTALLCGLYVNELLQRLLQSGESCPRIFLYYRYVLNELQSGEDIEGALRTFERQLLEELGFGLGLHGLDTRLEYRFESQLGLVPAVAGQGGYSGRLLAAIAEDNYRDEEVRRCAKRLMRQALGDLLGDRPLNSRLLFSRIKE